MIGILSDSPNGTTQASITNTSASMDVANKEDPMFVCGRAYSDQIIAERQLKQSMMTGMKHKAASAKLPNNKQKGKSTGFRCNKC